MQASAHTNPEQIEALITSLTALGSVPIPSGTAEGFRPLGAALETINHRRQMLTRTHARILVLAKTWAAEAIGRKAEHEIKVADLYENDPEVRAAPNRDGRMARARARAVEEHRSVVLARKEQATWAALLQVCETVQDNLKIAKESVSRLLNIAEMELQSSTLGQLGSRRI